TRRGEDERPPPPGHAAVKRYSTGRRRRVGAWVVALVAAGSAAIAFVALAPGEDAPPPPGEPVSSAQVARLANSFAAAYKTEDAARLERLLTSDAQRVTPRDRQKGRAAVVAEYRRQFEGNRTTDFQLEDLKSAGG